MRLLANQQFRALPLPLITRYDFWRCRFHHAVLLSRVAKKVKAEKVSRQKR
jgi:hypothetical protein